MRKTILLTSLRNLEITEALKEYFCLMPGINITNSDQEKIKIITPDIAMMIGVIELDHLMQSPNLIFCEFTEDDVKSSHLEPFLITILFWINGLFRSAWVLFDHSIECEAAYLFSYDKDGLLEKSVSNFLAQRNTLSDCTTKTISLNLDLLKEWEKLDETICRYLHKNESTDLHFFMEKSVCRSGRAFQYINNARNALNVGFKISHYISAFEALFSTSSAELSHKLSERVAFFLGQYGFEKRIVFRDIKKAYEIRSKLVHGDSLSKNTIANIAQISITCDSYLRNVMQLLFGSKNLVTLFDVPQSEFDEYFEKLILK